MDEVHFRRPVMGDAAEVAGLVNLCEGAASPEPDDFVAGYTAEEMRARWQTICVETDAWVATTAGDVVVSYLDVHIEDSGAHINSASAVHPSYRGRGIGTTLLRNAEGTVQQRVTRPDGSNEPYPLSTWISHYDERATRMLTKEGYRARNNSVWGMAITMNDPPPPPVWPKDVTVRSFVPGRDDEAVKSTIEDAFERPFTSWDALYTNREDFDPTLWHLARADGRIMGALLCDPVPAMGYIDLLGVRREWRGRGLGTALLRHAFEDFYRRGLRRVELSVNATNPDAPRLYERAGMHVVDQIDEWRKEL